jgi:hypothetical protein
MDLIEVLKHHPRALGITGDSITFIGGIFLAIDALFKKEEQIHLAAEKLIAKDFGESAQNKEGGHLDPTRTEEKTLARSVIYAKIGTGLLTLGFGCLLLVRILGEK